MSASEPEKMTLNLSGHDITLELAEGVFTPTTTTKRLAENVDIRPGDVVLDLGCGAGPLTLYAAKMGARHVYALDIMQEACDLTRRNVEAAGLSDKVTIRCSDLYSAVDDLKFDVIIDDVSGVAERVARISPWFPETIPTGGFDGTSVAVRMLEGAQDHLTPTGRIYFPVLSLSRSARIVECAREVFGNALENVASYRIPFTRELLEYIDELNALRDQGIISFEALGSRFAWTLDIFRGTCQSDTATA